MFCKDLFPPTAALGTRAAEVLGNSGNAALDSAGVDGPRLRASDAAGPGTETGPRAIAGAGAADTHGVARCCWRNAGEAEDEAAGCKAGKRSGGRAGGIDGDDEDDAAARATRSQTWREDCKEVRAEVDCFACKTRPLVMPDHSVPMAVGTNSGNWPRCYNNV